MSKSLGLFHVLVPLIHRVHVCWLNEYFKIVEWIVAFSKVSTALFISFPFNINM